MFWNGTLHDISESAKALGFSEYDFQRPKRTLLKIDKFQADFSHDYKPFLAKSTHISHICFHTLESNIGRLK